MEFDMKPMSSQQRIKAVFNAEEEWLKCCILKYVNSRESEFNNKISIHEIEDQSMISTVEKVLYLKNIELFNEIPAEELTSIAKLAQEHTFGQNEYLIRQGNPGKNFYVITSGVGKVEKGGLIITELKENDVLGEISANRIHNIGRLYRKG